MAVSQQSPLPPLPADLGILRHLWPYVRPYGWLALGAGGALLVAAGMVLGIGHALRAVIDQGLAAGNRAMLDQTLVAMVGVVIVLAIATYARFSCITMLGEKVIADLRRDIFGKLLTLDAAFYETARTGDVLSRMSTDTALLQSVVGSTVSIALRNAILLTGSMALMALASGKLTLLIMLVVPLVVVPIIVLGRKVRAASKLSQEKLADIHALAEETLYGIKTVQAFTHEAQSAAHFTSTNQASLGAARQRVKLRATLTAIVITLVFSAVTFILWIGGHDVLNGNISPGQLSAFIFYTIVMAGAVGAISEVMGEMQRAAAAMERIFELLHAQPAIMPPAVPRPLALPAPASIGFHNVTFAYPARPDQPVLRDFSLTLRAGERAALVGPSGAGKTTLFQLILRFYDAGRGSVTFDGIDLRELNPLQLRQQIGLVPQEPVIFSANGWKNISYGKPEASQAEILAAAKAAHAHEFLSQLPQGYDSFLGEKGVRLSGGQKQRLAIARAILRNPPLLLLDEATSALDAENERLVQEALERLMQGRTTLVIAHRLSTIQHADRILVLDGGQIVESGKHAELMRADGLYARLAKLQRQA